MSADCDSATAAWPFAATTQPKKRSEVEFANMTNILKAILSELQNHTRLLEENNVLLKRHNVLLRRHAFYQWNAHNRYKGITLRPLPNPFD
jgi:hypothetical protein